MKKIIWLILLFSWTIFSSVSAAGIKDHPRMAVMNFGNKAIMSSGIALDDMAMATEYAIYQLAASGWFELIDYEQLQAIINIHELNLSGLVDPGTVIKMGKFTGAQYLIIGNVTGLTTKESEVSYNHGGIGGLGNYQHMVTANVTMRIIDAETGRIVVAGIGNGSSTSTNTEIKFTKYRTKKTVSETTTAEKSRSKIVSADEDTAMTIKNRSFSQTRTVNYEEEWLYPD